MNTTPERAEELARDLLDRRMTSIRELAAAQVEFERAETARKAALEAATAAGWTDQELTQIGVLGDGKKTRPKRRRRTTNPNTASTSTEDQAPEAAETIPVDHVSP